jgi:hypothetical protein
LPHLLLNMNDSQENQGSTTGKAQREQSTDKQSVESVEDRDGGDATDDDDGIVSSWGGARKGAGRKRVLPNRRLTSAERQRRWKESPAVRGKQGLYNQGADLFSQSQQG